MRSVFWVFALLPYLAFASGYSGANGTNKLGESIYIGDDGGDGVDTIYVSEKGAKVKERYVLKDECPSFFDWGKQFSCRKNGKSPLAGTTYRVTTSEEWKPCGNVPPGYFNGEVYVCIAGCNNPRAPKIFYVNPWECTP